MSGPKILKEDQITKETQIVNETQVSKESDWIGSAQAMSSLCFVSIEPAAC
jgi:hypothetical protein